MSIKTPYDPEYVRRAAQKGTPAEAVVAAWTEPGPNPHWHEKSKRHVRDAMPLLAAALDRLAAETR